MRITKAHSTGSSHHCSIRLDDSRPADLRLSLNGGDIRFDVVLSVADGLDNAALVGREGSWSQRPFRRPDAEPTQPSTFGIRNHIALFRRHDPDQTIQVGIAPNL